MSNAPIMLRTACLKTLSMVEAVPEKSNQHEFNGVAQLKDIFGEDRRELKAKFSVRGQDGTEISNVTWYDARVSHPSRSEYRLYFQANPVMALAREGDNILIGFDRAGELHCVLIPQGAEGYNGRVLSWQKMEEVISV